MCMTLPLGTPEAPGRGTGSVLGESDRAVKLCPISFSAGEEPGIGELETPT